MSLLLNVIPVSDSLGREINCSDSAIICDRDEWPAGGRHADTRKKRGTASYHWGLRSGEEGLNCSAAYELLRCNLSFGNK